MDYGYPQFTEAKILSEYIKTDAYAMEVLTRRPLYLTYPAVPIVLLTCKRQTIRSRKCTWEAPAFPSQR
jgi:hypothetical protein